MNILERAEQGQPFLVADNGQFLGKLTLNQYDLEFISNSYGSYGSQYPSTSIKNQYSQYGSPYPVIKITILNFKIKDWYLNVLKMPSMKCVVKLTKVE